MIAEIKNISIGEDGILEYELHTNLIIEITPIIQYIDFIVVL